MRNSVATKDLSGGLVGFGQTPSKSSLNAASAMIRRTSEKAWNNGVMFEARFGGIPMEMHVLLSSVLGLYAKENGRGMLFPEDDQEGTQPPDEPTPPPTGGKRPALKGSANRSPFEGRRIRRRVVVSAVAFTVPPLRG